jgi:hypothetical protein
MSLSMIERGGDLKRLSLAWNTEATM